MVRFDYRQVLFVFALLLLLPASAFAGERRVLSSLAESGITVFLESWAGIDPDTVMGRDCGLLPLTVTIKNGSSIERAWEIEPLSQMNRAGSGPSRKLVVPSGGEGRVTVYVDPGPSNEHAYVYLSVRGYGLPDGVASVSIDSVGYGTVARRSSIAAGGSSELPFFPSAISLAAFSKTSKTLGERFTLVGPGIDFSSAPEDWRGWTIFSNVILDESEWIAMPLGQRKAMTDWVGLGGKAGVLVTDASPDRLDKIGLPEANSQGTRRVGAGEFVPIEWSAGDFAPGTLDAFLLGSERIGSAAGAGGAASSSGPNAYRDVRLLHPKSTLLAGYGTSGSSWSWSGGFRKLVDKFGDRQIPVAPILWFVAVLSLTAGPLNLIVLASRRRRSRMFWTTPLISLVAALLLFVFVLIQDGVGGRGTRRMLCLLMPEQNGVAIIQEQFSRTGLLVGNAFPMEEPSWMRLLGGEEHRYSSQMVLLEVEGVERRGGWFQSRSDQAYLVETVRPSRANIEFITDGEEGPSVISSIDVPLDRLFVVDDERNVWTATEVGTGERKLLEPSDSEAFEKWLEGNTEDAGPIRKQAMEQLKLPGYVFAESRKAARFAVETLPSIRWNDEKAVFIGPYVRTTAQ